ncbi:dynein heavy chain 5, axonemal-like [Octopus sinensis]|uniref:Dynein heavy chain 5, axonemal-like n=1 Tax=Octopus sinensis TaxID=2607531 RepID=A0A7E6F232_9MOLL|nr:dynein heavy chain 5, axonemal-like [Octopus sinensis]
MQLKVYANSLSRAVITLEQRLILSFTETKELLKDVSFPLDCNVAAGNRDLVFKLENVLNGWSTMIETVLAESEQLRREENDVGPQAELIYWKSRMFKFNNVLEQLKSKEAKSVMTILQAAKSKLIKKWIELSGRITDVANEARDNVKYLHILDKFLDPIISATNPNRIADHISSLMNAIQMIYCNSQYFNTSERMTSLFVKITNQLISTCKAYLLEDEYKIWDRQKDVVIPMLQDCMKLNEKYHEEFCKTKEYLKYQPSKRQFEFSEHCIFWKFDAFCKRLEKIQETIDTINVFLLMKDIKIDGIESVLVKNKTIIETMKKKNYDIFDYRNNEFDQDYVNFMSQIDYLCLMILVLIDSWIERFSTQRALALILKFEMINKLDLNERFFTLLRNYGKDLETIRKLYQKQRADPEIPNNIPPTAGRIMWAQQLHRKIEEPMKCFIKKPEIVKHPDGQRIMANYRKLTKCLQTYELCYYHSWYKAVVSIKRNLHIPLLMYAPANDELFVNFDIQIFDAILETKWIMYLGLDAPGKAKDMVAKESSLKILLPWFQDVLNEFKHIKAKIPSLLIPVMGPYYSDIYDSFEPGMKSLTWTSINIDTYIKTSKEAVDRFKVLVKRVTDLLECQIDGTLEKMSMTTLCSIPDNHALTIDDFVEETTKVVAEAATNLSVSSKLIEMSVGELFDLLKSNLELDVKKYLIAENGYPCTNPDTKYKNQPCNECLACGYHNMLIYFTQKNTDALVKSTRMTLNLLKRTLQSNTQYKGDVKSYWQPALFKSDIILEIPDVVLRPSLEDLQHGLNKAVNIIINMAQNIEPWRHLATAVPESSDVDITESGDEQAKVVPDQSPKTFFKIISEHKDIVKIVIQLNSTLTIMKANVQQILKKFSKYSELWTRDMNEVIKELVASNPGVSEFEENLRHFRNLQQEIEQIESSYTVGPIEMMTENLKTSLTTEVKAWEYSYAKALNEISAQKMNTVFSFFDRMMKSLSHPVKDLDDVRALMAAITEGKEAEVSVELNFIPIEEAYSLLHKYGIVFNDGNAERLDSFAYLFSKVKTLALEVQGMLLEIQPQFKTELSAGVEQFAVDYTQFLDDYSTKGPMEEGIEPREASDRMKIFQCIFDELWGKYLTYSGGEELFGLPVTEYPDLLRIKKELNLLQKLYQLYNAVLASVSGYYDIPWTEIDIDKINAELLEFQTRCRKLPKALKQWKAFFDLSKTIDDFNETCPLLEMMANKAMQPRHWERIEALTKHKFDVESDTFLLKNLMEAPLLPNKEDIEDVCISAVKEKDIEAKLKQVIQEWATQELAFSTFKNRGELLLKGDTITEAISLNEDSLMVLGSLLSNRYNIPFKAAIQTWVTNLSTTAEIIENWIMVQNLWIYLEAVFVGGDIAKQLPQEAKRFSTIDKSWVRIMQRAHEIPNIVACCVGDDILSQQLPYLLEQLEMCQRSLTGYLEKKRLVFPRFFFVSDPALLEILGQASDSHTIQSHLLSCFDNIKSVRFDEKNYDKILSVHSSENETVTLDETVLAQGNVEVWLGDLLRVSRHSLHAVIRSSYFATSDPMFKLIEFQNAYPAQVGLLGLQIMWTRDSEEALSRARVDKKIMGTINDKFGDILNELINVTMQELSKVDRTKFETLVTIHVHQKDIFEDLVRMHIRSVNDFEWLKQSRFSFKEDIDQCIISITDVNFTYMNEFLGCTDRLVITPLTDRCYISLAQALGMSLGGAPAGPAGTGKTETTKDMGRCLGKYVVIFNCSDQMDYRGLGRIYKGLAQSGSWGCFDEFNRIELPVLSVAAQQIAIVLTCKKERKPNFIFTDGTSVDMDPEFGLFITMNPGYAGRQELPENLKINFRTVAMMVPDRGIIMRVKMASCGFQQNILLAQKFFTLYKLCEEQLTKQVHYDFGLRNILSVLRILGSSKRENQQDSEATIVMRVLRDMNLSKLVDEDEPLFMSLIDDLFPGMKLEKAGYPQIEAAICKQVTDNGLIVHPPWILKLVQLYETQSVRHGMMTLGPSGSGKTKCIHMLQKALTACGFPHKEMRMNPKAITAPQMFGRLDVATNDWTDGIFSTLWRKTLKSKKGEHIWIVLDGPVDAIWIENLNSVLDDNKTLTLANGDRIPMAPLCKIIFEVHNIDNASPATVSRNGMVFMSSSILNWDPLLQAWLATKPLGIRSIVYGIFEETFPNSYIFLLQNLCAKMQLLECNYVAQALTIMEGYLPGEEELKDIATEKLQNIVVFALMWSLGSLLELDDRLKLEIFWKESFSIPLPPVTESQTIFEYVVSDKGMWEHWSERITQYVYPKDSTPDYTTILIPNIDNVRTDFLIHLVAKQCKAVLLIGEQGTAKTVMVQAYCSKYNPEEHLFKSFSFSSASTPLMFQRTMESYVEKRMGTTYGPPAGKRLTIFIDDINMPIINEWGDQVTNEITRQMIEMNGFYNLEKPGEFTTITDIQLLAAMIHPGGGRNDIPQRLKRQFSIFNCTLPSNNSVDQIFQTIGCGHFCKERHFPESVIEMIPILIPATRKLWQDIKVKMLPTPAKFHYVFNLRDLSRIWQGMLKSEAEVINSAESIVCLWKHECTRVLVDRFINVDDKNWFEKVSKELNRDVLQTLVEKLGFKPYFVNFLRDPPEATGDEAEDAEIEIPKVYEEIYTFPELNHRLISFMTLYNEAIRGAHMDLVFFKDAMIHLIKISRIICTTKGHALLVGVGGSGKQSLTRLASFIAGYTTFQITLTRSYTTSNLMDDLKYLYRTAGQHGKGITFLFTDNEIKEEGFLGFLNNILATGEVANLFARDEIDEIIQELFAPMKKDFPRRPPTNENCYDYYLSRVKKNLHVVLCFSPVGEKFRSRALQFPGLISGCTMDWFQGWPRDALVAVSNHFLASFEIICSDPVKEAVIETMGSYQDIVSGLSVDYFNSYRRQTHVTPKSYLSFIKGYKQIYTEKKKEIGFLADRMNTGLSKLVEASEAVNELSLELVEKEKELEIASQEADVVLKEVTIKAQAAEKVKRQVQAVKDKAQAIVDLISDDKAIAEKKLEAAKPALLEAELALQTIKPAHISTVKKLAKPPHLIMRIMDVVLILFQRRLDISTKDPDLNCPKPSWSEALKLMSGNFLNGLLTFPKDTINSETVELMQIYLRMEDYTFETAKKVCGDVAGLLSWTCAMAIFFGINKEVLPLKANLVAQEARLKTANQDLEIAQSQLDEKQAELDVVQAVYDEAMRKKQALVDDADNCRRKMGNATALIEGLSGEKIRWTDASKDFARQIQNLVGNVLLATGFLSYTGPYNQEFRDKLMNAWKQEMTKAKIPFTPKLDIINMLVDTTTITEWNLQGLPNDELSTQNGLIVNKAALFPLLIDPQGQGKAWIKNREKENNLQITSLNHKYFRTHLEDSLSAGRPLLIEDIEEELDPALDNILEKNVIKIGTNYKVKIGDKEVDYDKYFRLYITTKLSNPAYTPEISARSSIIDFTVTLKGLEDQLLSIVIVKEKQELESERTKMLEEVTSNKRKIQELEDALLHQLTSTEGSLVEDESLIQVLENTKTTAADIAEKLRVAAETEIMINAAREEFRPVASQGSIAYFVIVEMSLVNVMYQTSLKQFLGIFDYSIKKSAKSPVTSKRIMNIIEHFTFKIFSYTCRGLYERDKFLFTLLLTIKIAIASGAITPLEFDTFIKGGAALDLNAVQPKPKKWISDMTWLNLVTLSNLPQFGQILGQVSRNDKAWKHWFDDNVPEEAQIPDGYTESLDSWHKLLLIRSWCPDRVIPMARIFVSEAMGPQFAESGILNLEDICDESDNHTPLICFLSMGSDPTSNIEKLAKKKVMKCGAISMGQGQEVHARKLVSMSMQEGHWVLLQNCHLGLEFMTELFVTVTTIDKINEDFRCWVTTEEHPKFPINLLQVSLKFTNEPPQGIKAGLKRTYGNVTQEQLDINATLTWKIMLYAVGFLHTTVQERRKFGPIGWNIPYEFNQADFTATVQFIQTHLDEIDPKKGVSWSTVRYMISEVQYGGRVTDDYDKRLLNTFAKVWFCEEMFSDTFSFYTGYTIPKSRMLEDFRQFIEQLPPVDTPQAFGLHPNADITYQTNTANDLLLTMMNIQPKESRGGEGETRESVVYRHADDMLEKMPHNYNPFEVKERLKKMGIIQPMNIFLRQEVDRMQLVISAVRSTLVNLKLGIDGTIIINENLRDALDNIFNARVPVSWKKISWDAATLGFWFTDLIERNEQFYNWVFEGRPNYFWMTGFFNPQGFLTAMRQEITRAHKGWALDAVVLNNNVTKSMKEDINSAPQEGVYVHGLFLDGAAWDKRNSRVIEQTPKVLNVILPVVHIFAINTERPKSNDIYDCPVYKKPQRTDLTYIFPLLLKTNKPPEHWILRGVALLCDIK